MAEPQPYEKLLSLADLLAPSAIRAAATLRLADHLHAGATTSAALAERAGTRPDVTDALLRYLTELGILTTDEAPTTDAVTHYALTALGEPLLSDHPRSVREVLRGDSMIGHGTRALLHLDHTVRTGEPSHFAEPGGGYWETVNNDPAYAGEWAQQARAVDAHADLPLAWGAEQIVTAYDWSRARTVVDVGGHLGVILLALLRRHPHLRGTLVDLKNVAEQAAARFARSDAADRAEAVVGSFFEPLPAGADVYLLSAILADWDDKDAVRILENCREAAGPHGRILLADVAMPLHGAATELQYRSMMPAPARDAAELEALCATAGLRVTWRGPATGVRTLLELAAR
ncbi:carminomycin 4-O-methyltransferase [Streptomyces lincolnensis]|uniref:Carminomycin 4-O-methyltransferase n=1 Tax=Streptomyces lincolnensis TaxID=1915 RepID=A0A1B1MHG0_STRLN|nr:methyltransferase [Streptomyces lincolnensis]ANS68055.1 carminomycin 4-O-methyltransferase [Streptomyces lincolnensis]AXG53739.1 carminomycin 4-O-methyltransferase [Streptomyces lincolnensis]QMV09707.1 methyltransferase [Streptomyces lincolnensis]